MARRRVPLAEFDIATNPDMQRTLTVLTAARLLTADRGTVEVAHEALFREWPRLEAWLDEDQQSRRVRAHLTEAAHEWDESGRTPGELYRGARLAAVLDWTADHAAEVNDLERQFVAESQAAGEAEERRQRRANRRLRLLLVGASRGPGAGGRGRASWRSGSVRQPSRRTPSRTSSGHADGSRCPERSSPSTPPTARTPSGSGRRASRPRTSTSRCCSPARGWRSRTLRRPGRTCLPRSSAARRRIRISRPLTGRPAGHHGQPGRLDAARQEQRRPGGGDRRGLGHDPVRVRRLQHQWDRRWRTTTTSSR